MPAKLYSELQDQLGYDIYGGDRTNFDTDELVVVKERINQTREKIYAYANWVWSKRRGYFITTARYNDGTIDVTQYNETVSGTTTVFTTAMVGRYLIHGDVGYKIRKFTSTTALEVEVPYVGDTATEETYSICQPEYTLPYYVREIAKDSMRIVGANDSLTFMTEEEFHDDYPNPSSVESIATKYRLPGYTDSEYETGTATMAASASVPGSSTSWTYELIGRAFRVSGESEVYRIKDVTSTTALTLDRAYGGSNTGSQTYLIDPNPCIKIWLYPFLTQKRGIEFWYWTKPDPLINAADIDKLMPGDMHEGISLGTKWLWYKYTGSEKEQFAEGQFYRWLQGERSKKKNLTKDKSVGLKPHPDYIR